VRIRLLLVTTCVIALLAGPMCLPSAVVSQALAQQPTPQGGAKVKETAVITMDKGGEITIELFPGDAPKTVENFVTLAKKGFYDGLTFHRVEPNFVIQGGDPKGDGTGGPGYTFPDEPVHNVYVDGAVAMANSGPNTNGSQFFICTGSQCQPLQPQYNLFGKVESGLDVAQKVQKGDVMSISVAEQT